MFEKKFYWYRLAVCPEIGKSGVKERERERDGSDKSMDILFC